MVYRGSKKRLLKKILPVIHKAITDFDPALYVEPFVVEE